MIFIVCITFTSISVLQKRNKQWKLHLWINVVRFQLILLCLESESEFPLFLLCPHKIRMLPMYLKLFKTQDKKYGVYFQISNEIVEITNSKSISKNYLLLTWICVGYCLQTWRSFLIWWKIIERFWGYWLTSILQVVTLNSKILENVWKIIPEMTLCNFWIIYLFPLWEVIFYSPCYLH